MMKSNGNLEKTLSSGGFAVTAELSPPVGNDVAFIRKKAGYLKGQVDAVNITDNPSAKVHMSSLSTSIIAIQEGLEPVWQMTCRDRNRIAMQSEILGACALGVNNMLCLSGDHPSFGNQPYAKGVFDIDSTQLIGLVRGMRDEKNFLEDNKPFDGSTNLFIGGAANPFSKPYAMRPLRFKKKVLAGLDFVQTQCIYDMDLFTSWLKAVCDMGLDTQCHILAGVTPLKSANMARFMAEKVAGVVVPDDLVKRMAGVPKEKAAEEGIAICCEQIQQLREMPGVHGIHLMAIEWEHRVPDILEKAGLKK